MQEIDIFSGVVFPYINLAVFLFLAVLVLRGPIKRALTDKREGYQELVRKATAARELAEKRNQELQVQLKKLDQEVEAIHRKGREQAELEASQLLASTDRLADHLKKEAQRIAETELAAAKAELRREIIEQVKTQTAVKIQEGLDEARQQRVVRQAMGSVDKIQLEEPS